MCKILPLTKPFIVYVLRGARADLCPAELSKGARALAVHSLRTQDKQNFTLTQICTITSSERGAHHVLSAKALKENSPTVHVDFQSMLMVIVPN